MYTCPGNRFFVKRIQQLVLFLIIYTTAYPQQNSQEGYRIGISLSAVFGAGEKFVFSLGTGQQITINEPNRTFYFPGTFPTGTSYSLTQVSGPRLCDNGSPLSGAVDTADVNLVRGCGGPASKTTVHCQVKAPAGSRIVFQNNGAQDMTVTTDSNGLASFRFPDQPNGSPYKVTVKSAPAGMEFSFINQSRPVSASGPNHVRITGDFPIELVSRGTESSETGTFFESWEPAVDLEAASEDAGRYVVFISQAKGLCGASGKYRQIFRRDRLTGKTVMISCAPNGEEGNGNSFAPFISVSPHVITFESYASNLVGNDGNGVRDIFMWRRQQTGFIIDRISESSSGAEANAESFDATASGMGAHVVFASSATNLLDDKTEVSGVNVYLWERNSKKVTLLSKDPKTGKGVGGEKPSIDMNGYKVAFWSYSYTLDPDDKNNLWDIFLYQRNSSLQGLPLRRITKAFDGSERNQGDESSSRVVAPVISGDGNFITYATTASNVVPDDNNKMQDVFVYDISANTTIRASVDNNGQEGNGDSPYSQGERIAISYNGSRVAFTTKASNFGVPGGNVVIYDLGTRTIIPVTSNNGGYVSTPSISRKGKYVAFGCSFPLDSRFSTSGLFIKEVKQ